jgi:crossover junction endodeoxyribonuclease RuvC
MLFLGIDPGTTTTGYGLVEEKNNKLIAIDFGCIKTEPRLSSCIKLKEIYRQLEIIITKFRPTAAAVEKIFFCKNAKTALDVGQARGLILFSLAKANLTVFELTPLEVKQAVTGYGRASKKQIQKMVKLLLNLKIAPQSDDAADALALAISCALRYRTNCNYKLLQ